LGFECNTTRIYSISWSFWYDFYYYFFFSFNFFFFFKKKNNNNKILGPNLVRAYSDRRFPTITGEESAALRDYGYHISARAGSGEYALNVILSTV